MALDAIYTAVTGLQSDSTYLDIIGNNLANQNTTGFKAQRPEFEDLVYQTLQPGSAPTSTLGAINPTQLGFGTSIGSIASDFSQPWPKTSGNSTLFSPTPASPARRQPAQPTKRFSRMSFVPTSMPPFSR